MTFAEVVQAVLAITTRRDKTGEIGVAINAAINHYSLKARYYRDVAETSLPLDSTLTAQEVDISGLVRFRSFKYVKPTGEKLVLHPLAPERVFEPAGSMQSNCYYVLRQTLTVIMRKTAETLDVGYYQYPSVLSGTDTHWILDLSPYCVIDKAAARIFKSIGDEKMASLHEGYARDAYNAMIRDISSDGLD
jgi:hypothetical protein